jgi:hypothetical protein
MVLDAIVGGFIKTSIDLQIFATMTIDEVIMDIIPTNWYPLRLLFDLQEVVARNYKQIESRLEKIGESMMKSLYHEGQGKKIIQRGIMCIVRGRAAWVVKAELAATVLPPTNKCDIKRVIWVMISKFL